jgi:hypothetical protein
MWPALGTLFVSLSLFSGILAYPQFRGITGGDAANSNAIYVSLDLAAGTLTPKMPVFMGNRFFNPDSVATLWLPQQKIFVVGSVVSSPIFAFCKTFSLSFSVSTHLGMILSLVRLRIPFAQLFSNSNGFQMTLACSFLFFNIYVAAFSRFDSSAQSVSVSFIYDEALNVKQIPVPLSSNSTIDQLFGRTLFSSHAKH